MTEQGKPPDRGTARKEATPVEIAVLLMDAVCTPSAQEQEALSELAAFLRLDPAQLQTELMFLRAFAADFATSLTLGQSREREAILGHYYRHWERIDRQVGGVMADLQIRLQFYTNAVSALEAHPAGLQEQLGYAFVECCQAGEAEKDLVVLGGTMFGALFAEIADLLQEVDIVLRDGEGEAGRRD